MKNVESKFSSLSHPYDLSISMKGESNAIGASKYYVDDADNQDVVEIDSAGTLGTFGSAGGCFGTVGTFGCCC